MDFSRGVSFPEQKDVQIQGSWIPVTPAKPIPTRPQLATSDRQGSQLGRTNWLESLGFPAGFSQENSTSNGSAGTTACFDSLGSADQNRELNNWEAALAGNSTGSGYLVGSHAQAFRSNAAGWNNIPFADLLAITNAASMASASANSRGNNAASSPLFPVSYSQINCSQQQPNSASLLLANQDLSCGSNQWNNSNCQPQILQYGFPVPYGSLYDLNAPPRTVVDAASNRAMSNEFTPVTPGQDKRIQNQLSEIENVYVDERLNHEKDKEVKATELRNEVIELYEAGCSRTMSCVNGVIEPCSKELSHPMDSTAAISMQLKEIENPDKGDNHGIDLNKTPQQKSKRKKIRPRVVKEGKPKRTPKPETPKQASAKQNPSGKRKYVRKTGFNDSESPPARILETIDPTLRPTLKSCKRALNFDFEGQARDKSPGTSFSHQEGLLHRSVDNSSDRGALSLNSESQAQVLCNRINEGSGIKSTLHPSQGIEVTANNTAGIAYDLNSSMNQLDYISLPKESDPSPPQPTKRDPPSESLKVLARNRSDGEKEGGCPRSGENIPPTHQHIQAEGIGQMVLQTGTARNNNEITVPSISQSSPPSISKTQNHSNMSTHVPFAETKQARGSKREYSHATEKTHLHTMNLIGANYNSLQVYQNILRGNEYQRNITNQGLHFPEIYKKKRTEKGQYTTVSSSSSTTTKRDGLSQESHIYHGTSAPQLNNINSTKGPSNRISKSVQDVYVHSMAMEQYCSVPNTSTEPLSHTQAISKATIDKLQLSGCMLNFGHMERKTKKRSKSSTRFRDLNSLTVDAQCNQSLPTPPKTATTSGDRKENEIFHQRQACMEALVADNNAKMTTKKRTQRGSSIVNSASSNTNEVHLQENKAKIYDYHQSLNKLRGTSPRQKAIDLKESSRSPCILPMNSLHDHCSNSNYVTAFDAGNSVVSVEEIVQRLKRLIINDESNTATGEEQNALIPYRGNGTIVPYEGPFDPTKKRRPRPKVDLDSETNRVWKLLMGKEGSEGIEGMDKDKEKWWEEERRVFRGRADSFIARMHLVQGDRRFSQWKGSVVDSVIGVFLTQNVSDHLSSSAFMSLAARFPLQSKSNHRESYERTSTTIEEPEVCILDTEDTIKWNENVSSQRVCDQGSMTFYEAEHIEEKEVANSNESFGSNMGVRNFTDNSRSKQLVVCESGQAICHKLPQNRIDILPGKTGIVNLVETEDRKAQDEAVSSQNSADSCIFQTTERIGSCSESNSEAEDLITQSPSKPSSTFNGSTSFMELLQMAGTTKFHEFYNCGTGNSSYNPSPRDDQNQSEGRESDKHQLRAHRIDCLQGSSAFIYKSNVHHPHKGIPITPSSRYSLHMTPDSGVLEVECPELLGEESRSSLPSTASEITDLRDADCMSKRLGPVPVTVSETTVKQKGPSSGQAASIADQYGPSNKHSLYSLHPESYTEKNPHCCNNQQRERTEIFLSESTPVKQPANLADALAQRQNSRVHQISHSPNTSREVLDVMESAYSVDKQKSIENEVIQSNSKQQVFVSGNSSNGTTTNDFKAKKVERMKKVVDWDSLRKEASANGAQRERNNDTMDSVDWEAIRCADVNEIANAIKERGMNNMLAERIKDFLNRLVREHGSIDLEWLRDVPPDKAKDYLLSVRGLGLKSVECVRLLTLHQLAFPVDTNVGRIAVRLGWVPLQPLPESLQLHLLELYPVLESIQKYLWPRLCTLDQRTLYELHYQMITFGKVFCTKSKPNCNACPMRGECKHFASAFASARLALPGTDEKGIVSSTSPVVAEQNPPPGINPTPLPLPEANLITTAVSEIKNCEPIIEEPATPEPECTEITASDIEDAYYADSDEIPTIKLNIEEFTLNLQNYMQENNMELQEGNMSKALVALTPDAASIPVPKLKNVSRLRTEHRVYELPDSHPLLNGMDRREPDDPSSYLLAIWTPGETAESTEPPKSSCGSQESGNLCNEKTCFSCNSIREANSQTVRGTLLIPCRTAMKGSFPLNGTYFQVNEMFADHDSSLNPIDVPRAWIWNLPRRTVYFGTSIPTIFKGLSTEEIQYCFWRGFVCVRGFDQKIRAPRPLMARLHFPASKLAKNKTKGNEE